MGFRGEQRTSIKRCGLHQRIVLGRGVDVCADAGYCAVGGSEFRDAKIGDLHDLMIRGEQKVLRFDVAMNDPAFMCMREPGADLLKIKERAIQSERLAP